MLNNRSTGALEGSDVNENLRFKAKEKD